MKSVNFTIKSTQSLRIGEVLQAEPFECYSVSAKDTELKTLYRLSYLGFSFCAVWSQREV